jgi:hypothetical protein
MCCASVDLLDLLGNHCSVRVARGIYQWNHQPQYLHLRTNLVRLNTRVILVSFKHAQYGAGRDGTGHDGMGIKIT